MKRKILVIALAAIAVSVAAAGTLAVFTAQGDAVNVITAGNIRMELHDEKANGEPFPEKGLAGLMPGETADKIVYVENTGDNPFYTRVKLNNSILPYGEPGAQLSFDKIALNIDTAHWQLGSDGWYYYLTAVDKGGETTPLFTEVMFRADMGNDYMDATVGIKVIAQAVQTANNGGTVWQAAGWPEE